MAQGYRLRWLAARALLVSVVLAASTAYAAEPWIVEGRVIGVSDGDTITVLDAAKKQHKIRLAGCDTPERRQPFGERAKQNLSALAFDRRAESACYKRDRYGRSICRVAVAGRDLCLEQVRAGLAWHFKRFANEQTPQERAEFAEAEDRARAARRGLWRDASPVAPWDWRDGNRAGR